jgi:hypothetical protein
MTVKILCLTFKIVEPMGILQMKCCITPHFFLLCIYLVTPGRLLSPPLKEHYDSLPVENQIFFFPRDSCSTFFPSGYVVAGGKGTVSLRQARDCL